MARYGVQVNGTWKEVTKPEAARVASLNSPKVFKNGPATELISVVVEPQHLDGLTDKELSTVGVRRIDEGPRPPLLDFQQLGVGSVSPSGDRAVRGWSTKDEPLDGARAKLSVAVKTKMVEVCAQGVDQTVTERSGSTFRFPTTREDREDYTIAMTLVNAGETWDTDFRWGCERNGNLRRVKLTEAEFRSLYSAMGALVRAANKRADVLLSAVEAATTVAELRALDITTRWPS